MVHRSASAIALAFALAACGPNPPADTPAVEAPAPATPHLIWSIVATNEATTLRLDDPGVDVLTLSCVGSPARMRLYHDGFRPIGSEERISFGAGGDPYVFVAQLDADDGPGVTGERDISFAFMDALSAGRLWRINYGAQDTGPFDAPPAAEMQAFVDACREIVAG